MDPSSCALRVRDLRKAFARPAVDGLSLEIAAGELYGLLGANGAGKTTTLRMVTGLLKPDAGSVEIFGIDALREPRAAKRLVAWLPDEPMLYDKLTPVEYLEFVAGLWQMPAARARATASLASARGGSIIPIKPRNASSFSTSSSMSSRSSASIGREHRATPRVRNASPANSSLVFKMSSRRSLVKGR